MLDIKFVRENPDIVKENIKKKFQDEKLPLVDEVIELDGRQLKRQAGGRGPARPARNALSKQIGALMGKAKKDPEQGCRVRGSGRRDPGSGHRRIRAALSSWRRRPTSWPSAIRKIMLKIPNIIDPSVPIGPDDSCNVEVQRFGEAKVPDFDVPYHTDIMESFNGIDLDAAGRVSRHRLLLPAGRHRPAPRGRAGLRPGLHDRQGLHLLHPPLYDPRQRGGGRHEPDRYGRHDV